MLFALLVINSPFRAFCQGSKDTASLFIPEKSAIGPDTVKIGVYIISLHNFNYHDKEFSMRFWLWSLYKNQEFDFRTQIEVPNAFMISSVSFFIHPEETDPRFGLSVGGLFAAVGNKYIIDSLLPETSQFTLVDTLHAITFVSIFLTIVISAICLTVHNKGKVEKAKKINSLARNLMIISYVLIN